MKFKMSEKDKKLLMVVGSILLLFCSYLFIYKTNVNKANEINESNALLDTKVQELEVLKAKEPSFKATIEQNNQLMKQYLEKIPSDNTYEKSIMTVVDMERATQSEIKTVGINLNNTFYDAAASTNAVTDGNEEGKKPETFNKKLTVYNTKLSLSYSLSFDGVKTLVDFINNYENYMTLDNISASFDPSTGLLSGSLAINLFSMNDSEKQYEAPVITDVNMGLDKLFHTLRQ